ncbi:MAG: acyl-CoA dehydrogenase family protein, partial [Sphingomonadales bacterium]|nr:acyl-CoA dehydrogenase family protein [Sphingomonadales bacterium]
MATAAQVENDGPIDRARRLGGLIDAAAAADEAATEVSGDVVAALHRQGLLGLMVPRELGGAEADAATLIATIREIAYHDGSAGWYAGAVMTAGAVSGAMLGPQAIAAIYRPGARAICAGQAAPTGKAVREGDGWRISGRFAFGSGCPEAEWLVGGYVVHDAGGPVPRPHGLPRMLIGFAPRATATFHGNWNVLGLRGTGSYDF